MESIRELYKIGVGPSSSHTMGPQKICEKALEKYPNATSFDVTLYGSLALTGKGHLTDAIIEKTLIGKECHIHWNIQPLVKHPNGMKIEAFENGKAIGEMYAYSIGGGSVLFDDEEVTSKPKIYVHQSFEAIKDYLEGVGQDLYTYILQTEKEGFEDYLKEVLYTMEACVRIGLSKEGILPGKLALKRVAKDLYEKALEDKDHRLLVTSYAYAVSETNASGGMIVTAPTCGASGILPAVMFHAKNDLGYSEEECLKALAVAGLIGNLVKTNATISGAEGGCQAEVGTATAMSAAAFASLLDLSIEEIEYAAEMGLEHQLGLTCDPVGGYVQIPCIERNAFGALRAIDAANYAKQLSRLRKNRVSFDSVVRVMKRTGKDLDEAYRETSLGGLAKELSV